MCACVCVCVGGETLRGGGCHQVIAMPGSGGGGGGDGTQPGAGAGQGVYGGAHQQQMTGGAGALPPLIACPSCSMRLQPPPVGRETAERGEERGRGGKRGEEGGRGREEGGKRGGRGREEGGRGKPQQQSDRVSIILFYPPFVFLFPTRRFEECSPF